jgi:hypothetical protein
MMPALARLVVRSLQLSATACSYQLMLPSSSRAETSRRPQLAAVSFSLKQQADVAD